jgi:hypothetical protein
LLPSFPGDVRPTVVNIADACMQFVKTIGVTPSQLQVTPLWSGTLTDPTAPESTASERNAHRVDGDGHEMPAVLDLSAAAALLGVGAPPHTGWCASNCGRRPCCGWVA